MAPRQIVFAEESMQPDPVLLANDFFWTAGATVEAAVELPSIFDLGNIFPDWAVDAGVLTKG